MASLIVFVYALAKSVYLLLPIRLYAVEVGKIMQRYDEEPLSYVMFKVISTWEDTIKKSIAKISTIGSNLGDSQIDNHWTRLVSCFFFVIRS